MISDQSKNCALELDALPSRIGQVRRIVSAQLRYWGVAPLIDPTLLGITELLTNVHRHARPDKHCTVELAFADGRLTVAVHDNDPRLPIACPVDPMAVSGRGIAMVAALSEAWGTRPEAEHGGKVVWFVLHERRSRLHLSATPSVFAAAEAAEQTPVEVPVEIPVESAPSRRVVTVA